MRSLVLGLVVFALGLSAASLATSPGAGAHRTAASLSGTVGPGFSISLSSSSVTAGDYTISVDDKSSAHNFHLTGPGVDKATSIAGTGSTSWSVTLQPGTYHFQCDAHASSMNGDLTVTAGTTTTTTVQTTTQAAPKPLSARIASVRAARAVVTVAVSSSVPGHAVAQLFAGTKRLAQASGAAPGTLRLRPAHPLKAGRYLVKLRVSAGGATAGAQRAVRVG